MFAGPLSLETLVNNIDAERKLDGGVGDDVGLKVDNHCHGLETKLEIFLKICTKLREWGRGVGFHNFIKGKKEDGKIIQNSMGVGGKAPLTQVIGSAKKFALSNNCNELVYTKEGAVYILISPTLPRTLTWHMLHKTKVTNDLKKPNFFF